IAMTSSSSVKPRWPPRAQHEPDEQAACVRLAEPAQSQVRGSVRSEIAIARDFAYAGGLQKDRLLAERCLPANFGLDQPEPHLAGRLVKIALILLLSHQLALDRMRRHGPLELAFVAGAFVGLELVAPELFVDERVGE